MNTLTPIITTATPQELHARKRAELAEQQLDLAIETVGALTVQLAGMEIAAAEQYAIIHGLNVKYDRLVAAARAYLRDAHRETRLALQDLV